MLKETLQLIENGRAGHNVGIPHGHERLSLAIPNIQKGTTYLLGAETGIGKTSFIDDMFVINPIEYMLNNESDLTLKILYFSFEIEKRLKMSKFIARHIYEKYGILTNINTILSRGKNHISEELYTIVLNSMKHFERYEDFISIIDKSINPTGILKIVSDYSNTNGIWTESEKTHNYKPYNKKLFTFIIIDHLNLMRRERGFGEKENIDTISSYAIHWRNKCGFTPIFVQQLNRSMGSADRFRIDRIEPQLTDYKGSATPSEDANIVMALFSPMRYEIETHRGYDIRKLRDHYRSLLLLKNRDGEADKAYGMKFLGGIGLFQELPFAKDMTQKIYDDSIT